MEGEFPIHPALDDLRRLFEPSSPGGPSEFRGDVSGDFRLSSFLHDVLRILDPPAERPHPLPSREVRKLRRWYGYQRRLDRARASCAHPEVLRVLWADWTASPLCARCGHQGHPLKIAAGADTLVIPRDLKELLAIKGLRSLERDIFRP